jgi:hypothetical protein
VARKPARILITFAPSVYLDTSLITFCMMKFFVKERLSVRTVLSFLYREKRKYLLENRIDTIEIYISPLLAQYSSTALF